MGSIRLTNLLGTFVTQALPSQNNDASPSLYARNWSSQQVLSYLYFTRPFPLGVTITSATLHVFSAVGPTSGTLSAYVRRLNQSVAYSTVNWNNRPTALMAGEKVVSKTGPYVDGTDFAFDITSDMQALADGAKWYGYQMRSTWTTTTFNPRWYSPQATSPTRRPYVDIVWSDAPDAPTRLSPAGGRAVGIATPILRFDFTDVSGDKNLASCQIQISTSTSFTSPAYDSGTQATTDPQFDLTGLFTMTASTVYYWRVRVQDGAGLWSAWSNPASMQYVALPSLTVNNPAVSPNNFVTEPTPPITWTAATQAAYQLGLYSSDAVPTRDQLLWSRGRTVDAVTKAVTLPANMITDKSGYYRIDVRVYDAVDRESVPNSPNYSQITRYFTYQFDNTVAGVATLSAAAADPRPGVTLTFTRSTAPDSFSVIRDNQVIASNLLPGDLFVSGTTYTWKDRTSIKNRTHTYTVQAVVNGKASLTNPTATVTNYIMGTWLLDADGTAMVCIVADKGRTMEYGEQSATYEVLGATKVSLVTQGLRGYSGTVNGELHDTILGLTETAAQWRTNLLALKQFPGQLIYLFVQDMTIPVVLQNVQVYPKPQAGPTVYAVEMQWHQQGLLPFTPRLG